MQLADKYRPPTIDSFKGLDRPKRILSNFAAAPYSSAWLLMGPSGLGKTTIAMALADQVGGQLHHIPSRQCDLATVEKTVDNCHYMPFLGGRFHVVLVDEADQMTRPAQLAFLSVLDSTAPPPDTIFVFTANSTDKLEGRFISRCKKIEFHPEEIDIRSLLVEIWDKESEGREAPDFDEIVGRAEGNVRTAINDLEIELIATPKPAPRVETRWYDDAGLQLPWEAIKARIETGNFEGVRFQEVEC